MVLTPASPTTMAVDQGLNKENDGLNMNRRNRVYEKDLTVLLEIDGVEEMIPRVLMRAASEVCGNIIACRQINKLKFEVTVTSAKAKERLMDGFRVGEAKVYARDVSIDELVVSFMGLLAYIEDEEILAKLLSWGVSAVSEVRRKMWPGTTVADGTRYVKVRFTNTVQSLPYSVRFNTAAGPDYFRVIHDRQVRVCRGCLQPDHILRDCPDFVCNNCGKPGHYARECVEPRARKCRVCRAFLHLCACNGVASDVHEAEKGQKGDSGNSLIDWDVSEELPSSILSDSVASGKEGASGPTLDQREEAREGLTSKAPVEAVEPGKRMGVGPFPHPASERGEMVPDEAQTPRPKEQMLQDQSKQLARRHSLTSNESHQKDGSMVRTRSTSRGRSTSSGHGERKVHGAHKEESLIPVPTKMVSNTNGSSTEQTGSKKPREGIEFLMELDVQSKKRQNEGAGKVLSKKMR